VSALVCLFVDWIPYHSSNAVLKIRWAIVLLWILRLLPDHGVRWGRSRIWSLSHHSWCGLLSHGATHTGFRSDLSVCISFPDMSRAVSFLFIFHLDVLVFLLVRLKNSSALVVHSQFWTRIPVHWASHSFIFFKNCRLMYLLELMKLRCCHRIFYIDRIYFVHLLRLETGANLWLPSNLCTLGVLGGLFRRRYARNALLFLSTFVQSCWFSA